MTISDSAPIECSNDYGTLVIDNVSLHTQAWCAVDLSELWWTPEVRGENTLRPHTKGRNAKIVRGEETRYSLPMVVTGYCDQDGDLYADFATGLETNVRYLLTYVALPTNTGDGTREAVWTLPSGLTVTSDVQVLGLRGALNPGAIYTPTLELRVPNADLHLGAAV